MNSDVFKVEDGKRTYCKLIDNKLLIRLSKIGAWIEIQESWETDLSLLRKTLVEASILIVQRNCWNQFS